MDNYSKSPNENRHDKRLKPLARLLYIDLISLSNGKGFCWANNRYLAGLFGSRPETVSRLLKDLENLKYIKVDYVDGRRQISPKDHDQKVKTHDQTVNGTHDQTVKGGMTKRSTTHDQKVKHNKTYNNIKSNKTNVKGEGGAPSTIPEVDFVEGKPEPKKRKKVPAKKEVDKINPPREQVEMLISQLNQEKGWGLGLKGLEWITENCWEFFTREEINWTRSGGKGKKRVPIKNLKRTLSTKCGYLVLDNGNKLKALDGVDVHQKGRDLKQVIDWDKF